MIPVQKERAATFTKQPAHKTTDDCATLLGTAITVNAAIRAAWLAEGRRLHNEWLRTGRQKHLRAYNTHMAALRERVAAGIIQPGSTLMEGY